jgi:hypothetical protein
MFSDGRVMDTFQSPGMAQGIFHEYLRGDDPISMEARNNFAEGFPFLLAPLTTVKFPSVTVPNPTIEKLSVSSGLLTTFAQNLLNTIMNQKNSIISFFDIMVTDGMNKLVQLSTSIGHYKEEESDRLCAYFHALCSKSHSSLGISVHSRPSFPLPTDQIELIAMNKRPEMTFSRRLFIITVHIYLLLLLVLSIPDSFPTKVIVARKSTPLSSLDSESDNEERNNPYGNEGEDDDSVNSLHPVLKRFHTDDIASESLDDLNKTQMRKALSYCF